MQMRQRLRALVRPLAVGLEELDPAFRPLAVLETLRTRGDADTADAPELGDFVV
jgi:hypothetical protein